MSGRLLSVNVGLPRDIAWQGKTVRTAVWKTPVQGRRVARRLNIDGDGQGDLAGHGGEHRAVFVYQMDSYRYWEKELGRKDFSYGQFGENFTIECLPDREVCVGDHYRIGAALFEVTQPRVTCYRVGIRLNEPRMPALLVERGRPGFYFRVLEEGQVQAGDEIVQVRAGPERMSVSEIDALLYLPGRSRGPLERALRIPALSAGWRGSFQALLAEEEDGGAQTKDTGVASAIGTSSSWSGFRKVRVSDRRRESANVTSLVLEAADELPLTVALPGQFVVLRLVVARGAPAEMRSYSLSGEPSDRRYRISVKRETGGVASAYINEEVRIGDVLEISAPRGDFILRSGDGPIVLLSAGVGATPVLAMLHALAAESTRREIWWLHGARNGIDHPFAEEAQSLLKAVTRSHRHILFSSPGPEDRQGIDFDASGRLNIGVLRDLDAPRDADFFLCGPSPFMTELSAGLAEWGVRPGHIHTEIFGAGPSKTPGIVGSSQRAPHQPAVTAETGPLVSFARSGINVRWGTDYQSLLELAGACDVPTRWACRAGVCHTCESGLVAGAVSYRPDPILPPPPGSALICCSRPQGDVVIDL
jgi:ferredoxin-NADP reductase/MOSC domain-containing protein YiiM